MLLECLIFNSGHVDFLRLLMMNVQMLLFETLPGPESSFDYVCFDVD